jgi:hypothetical protein
MDTSCLLSYSNAFNVLFVLYPIIEKDLNCVLYVSPSTILSPPCLLASQ